jgi:hypothetical protein
MSSRYQEIGLVQDPIVQSILMKMAADLDMLVGSYTGLNFEPATPFEGQVARFAADVVGTDAGLYEYRSETWNKL